MGDRPTARNMATETTPSVSSVSTATQVQTIAEVPPSEKPENSSQPKTVAAELQAWFEKDSTPDGSKLMPDQLFDQSWTIRNPGPHAWPAGCAVYFTGGDHMLNVDSKNPSSVTAMTAATKSNVLENTVEPGQTVSFTISLKTPEREGRFISYWRLKTPDALPFGHKLWVDITVAAAPVEATSEPKPEPVEVVNAAERPEEEIKIEESSTMIFPKLDDESPVSSVHGREAPAAPTEAETRAKTRQDQLDEYLESLELDEEGSDDCFLTDEEEYDILDAGVEGSSYECSLSSKK